MASSFKPRTYISKPGSFTLSGLRGSEDRLVGGEVRTVKTNLPAIRFKNHTYTAKTEAEAEAIEASAVFEDGTVMREGGNLETPTQPDDVRGAFVPGLPVRPGEPLGNINPPAAAVDGEGNPLATVTEVMPAPGVSGLAPPAAMARPELVPTKTPEGEDIEEREADGGASSVSSKNEALAYFESMGIDTSALKSGSTVADYKEFAKENGVVFQSWKG